MRSLRGAVGGMGRLLMGGFALVAALVLVAMLGYPDAVAKVVAHAAPDVSLYFNWFASNAFRDAGGIVVAAGAALSAKSLPDLLKDIKGIIDGHRGKPMPEAEAEKLKGLTAEAKEMQDELDRDTFTKSLEHSIASACAVQSFALPADEQTTEEKAERQRDAKARIVGYLPLGQFVTAQKAMQDFRAAGKPRQHVRLVQLKNLFESFVGLTQEQIREVKAVPTLGADVIEPTRLPEIVRVTEHDRLQLRDVLDISQTSSEAVKYTRLVSYTRAAAAVARSAQKPETTMELETVSETVRTLAVWMPVEEQQLDDMPALAGLINGELLYDVAKHQEELIMYGLGTGEEFLGILKDPAVLVCGGGLIADGGRIAAGDTLIDIVRRGITDVRRAGYDPNAILIDPLDWETVVLLKGTDDRYVWVVVTENGVQRLWGVPVIETNAMEDFAGNATEERNLLVGDYRRGATLWDRMQSAISVGWINDQFIRNQRTILAEWRGAFGVRRPGAFRKYTTQAAVAS